MEFDTDKKTECVRNRQSLFHSVSISIVYNRDRVSERKKYEVSKINRYNNNCIIKKDREITAYSIRDSVIHYKKI